MGAFYATMPFAHFNNVDVDSFCAQLHFCTHYKSSCWNDIADMLKLSVILSLQFSHPDLMFFAFWLSGYVKDVFNTPTAHLTELKAHIAQPHSELDPRDTAISWGTCYFSIWATWTKQWTAYLTRFALFSRNLKSNLMYDFYVINGLRTIENRCGGCFLCCFLPQDS